MLDMMGNNWTVSSSGELSCHPAGAASAVFVPGPDSAPVKHLAADFEGFIWAIAGFSSSSLFDGLYVRVHVCVSPGGHVAYARTWTHVIHGRFRLNPRGPGYADV